MESERDMGRSISAFALLVVLCVPITLHAQASIVGVVKDASGNALPGVAVEATSSVGEKRQTVTDFRGAFTIAGAPSGVYTLTFALSGFDIPSVMDVSVSDSSTVVTAIASIDDGCGRYRGAKDSCLTYRQVRVDVPESFRPLWDSGIRDVAAVQATLPCDSISLRRSGGMIFIAGHTFSLTLFRDGNAELRSQSRPNEDIDYTGTVSVWDYGKLCYLTQRVGFDRLAQHYSANWTDASGVTIDVVYGGRNVGVSEYSGIGPIELWAVEKAIEAIKGGIKWKRR
jgi:hypothetical protein